VVVGRRRALDRAEGPVARGVAGAVAVDGEVGGARVTEPLAAEHDADPVPAEGYERGQVVAGGRDGRHDVRGAPGGVIAVRVVHVDLRVLDPGGPEPPGRIHVDHQGLRPRTVDDHRETGVQRVATGRRVIAVAIQAARLSRRGRGARLGEDVRGDIQLARSGMPEDVRVRAVARVERRARVDPAIRRGVESMDAVDAGLRRVHARPPRAIVEPELALGLGLGRRAGDRRVAEPLRADVTRSGLGRGARRPQTDDRHGGHQDPPYPSHAGAAS
jgi:hypothetical protein